VISEEPRSRRSAFDAPFIIALVVAIGLCTAVNLLTLGVLYDAIRSQGPGLSENATQILTTAFGGMIGILGTAVGYRAGKDASQQKETTP